MSRKTLALVLAFVALAALPLLTGCGGEHDELHVPEGEPVELEGVKYNVVISRYMNPDLIGDAEYLGDHAEWPGPDDLLLGVFMQIDNHSGETITVPRDLVVVDTQDRQYRPVSFVSDFALELGSELEDGTKLPRIDSAAAYGPIAGSMVLFQITDQTVENRPLVLRIPGVGGEIAEITLDI